MALFSKDKRSCGSCTYWQYLQDATNGTGLGNCRRCYPVVSNHSEHSLSIANIAVWPITGASGDWCGDWKQR